MITLSTDLGRSLADAAMTEIEQVARAHIGDHQPEAADTIVTIIAALNTIQAAMHRHTMATTRHDTISALRALADAYETNPALVLPEARTTVN